MLEKLVNDKFEYKRLTEAEQTTRGILGRLIGPCADFMNPTRNGRKYSEELWENVFNNPIMKEKIANKVCFGELEHPGERTTIDPREAAVCLAEQPKKGKDGKLYAVFDILNTPNGKILKAFCDYGSKVGISSRGQGDLVTDMNGDEAVDPDTYDCECFDIVLVPGVESARLNYVRESLETKKSLKLALKESLNAASEDERIVMEKTLNNLNINLNEAKEDAKLDDIEKEEVADEVIDSEIEAGDEILIDTPNEEDIIEEPLQDEEISDEAEVIEEPIEGEESEEEDERTDEEIFLDFLANNFEEDKVKEVCDILDIEVLEDEPEEKSDEDDSESEEDKESNEDEEVVDNEESTDEESDDDIESDEEEADKVDEPVEEAIDERFSAVLENLKEAIKVKSDLENNVKELQEKLAVSDAKVDEINEECNKYKDAITRLSKLAKSNKDLKENVSKLEESLNESNKVVEEQKTRIARLVESRKQSVMNSNVLNENMNSKESEINKLNESLTTMKNDYEAKINTLNESLANANEKSKTEISKLTESLTKETTIKESYKKLANKAVNKYIEVKADILGVTTMDIKRKLGESYTMEDVDQVCEDLKSYQLNVSRLPFSIDRKVSVKVNESNSNRLIKSNTTSDDDVDDTLIKLANCN